MNAEFKVFHVVLQIALKQNTLFYNWIGKSIIDIKNKQRKTKKQQLHMYNTTSS
jgi:hypothetical protein